VEGLGKTRPPEGSSAMQAGLERVEDRLARLEESLKARNAVAAPAAAVVEALPMAAPAPVSLPPAPPYAEPVDDAMPRSPGTDAPLKEFGFPDLGPVRAALEAKTGPRLRSTADEAEETRFDVMPITPEMAGGATRNKSAASTETAPPTFDPALVARPPRPQSSLDAEVAGTAPASPTPDAPTASRNTFIEAARRAAQRQNAPASDAGSLIGKAFSRFQASPAGKTAVAVPAPAPIAPEPAPATEEVPVPRRR